MALARREFLKLTGGVWAMAAAPAVWQEARELVRGGALGRVVFCRASQSTTGLGFILDGAVPVCERSDREELVLCGTEATLVVDSRGYRRFA